MLKRQNKVPLHIIGPCLRVTVLTPIRMLAFNGAASRVLGRGEDQRSAKENKSYETERGKKSEREEKRGNLNLLNILISMSMLIFPFDHSIYQKPFKTPKMEMSIRSRVSDNPQCGLKNGPCRAHAICQYYKAQERSGRSCCGLITSDAGV